jgi:catechol 2,3-dioxygenase-like lactoylglutathione lyase family enzyme
VRLQHVNVVVPPGRTDAVVPFYEALGLARVPKPLPGPGAWFEVPGGAQVHVSERGGAPHPDQHFCLQVADLDALVARLAAAGHPWRELERLAGARRGMTRDPEGNAVELAQEPA